MASNRDPRPSYRRRSRKTVTSSSNRSTRSKKSTAPKPTSSSTRASTKGSSSRVTTGQGGSRAKVKIKPKSTGLIGTRNTPATKTKYTGPKTPGVKFNPSNRTTPKGKGGKGGGAIKATLTAGLAGALSSGKLRNPVSKAKKREAAKSIGKYNTRDKDGTVRNRKKVGPKKVGVGKVGTEAQNFDKAFAAARKAGKSTFTWKGKKYNTKMK